MEAGQSDACHAENESEVLVKRLKWRIRIVLTLALSLIVGGFLCLDSQWAMAGRWMLLIGLLLLPCVFWLRSQRTGLGKQGTLPPQEAANPKVDKKPTWRSLAGIVIISLIIAWMLIRTGDSFGAVLGGLGVVISVLMAAVRMRGKLAVAGAHLVAAAIYGAAAATVQLSSANVRNDADLIISKLEEYKKQHGSYPDRLDALVPALLPAIPKPGPTGFLYGKSEDSYNLHHRSVAKNCSYGPNKPEPVCSPN